MFKFFLFLLVVLVNYMPVLALKLNIKDQTGVVNQELKISLLPTNGESPYHYALKDSTLPNTWRIQDNTFYWTPSDSGFYTATFFVIDGKNNYIEDNVRFSIMAQPFNTKTEPAKLKIEIKNTEKTVLPNDKTQYLKDSMTKDEIFYQPVSLYYTNGKMPINAIITKDNKYVKLECEKGAKFIKDGFLPYVEDIKPPSLISPNSAKLKYSLNISNDVLTVVEFNLPNNVTVDGCDLIIDKYPATAYNLFPLNKKKLTQAQVFIPPTKINVNGGLLVLLTNEHIVSTKSKVVKSKAKEKIVEIDNPYLISLLSAPLPKDLQTKNYKNSLNKAEMAALVIYTLTNSSHEIEDIANKKLSYWGFTDVKAWEKYRGEIYQFKKLSYDKGIRADFSPKSMASMEDLYFALATPLNLKVKWWQKDSLKNNLIKLNLIKSANDLKEPLTLERAAKAIFYTQEVLTKRGQTILDKNDGEILLAKRNNLIDDNLIYRSQKSGGISRGDFLMILTKKQENDYTAFTVLKSQFIDKKAKNVIFDDIKIDNKMAPYIAYAYTQGFLPETWLKKLEISPEKNITKIEALEIILKSTNEYGEAQKYAKKITEANNNFYDLKNDKILSDKYFLAFYAQSKNIIDIYQDRYDNNLNLFLGEKQITLINALEMINNY